MEPPLFQIILQGLYKAMNLLKLHAIMNKAVTCARMKNATVEIHL